MIRSTAILDAGPLVAATDPTDPNHEASAAILLRSDLDFVIPTLVVGQATYLVGTRLGGKREAAFARRFRRFAIEAPIPDEWPIIADLIERYADFHLGTADAATIVLADRLETDLIATLDRRHFAAVRSPNGRRFRLLPELISVQEESAPYDAATAPQR